MKQTGLIKEKKTQCRDSSKIKYQNRKMKLNGYH